MGLFPNNKQLTPNNLFLWGMANHPLHTKFIAEAAEIGAPEHILRRHSDFPSNRKCIEQPVTFFPAIRLEHDMCIIAKIYRKPPGLRCICAHQDMTTRNR